MFKYIMVQNMIENGKQISYTIYKEIKILHYITIFKDCPNKNFIWEQDTLIFLSLLLNPTSSTPYGLVAWPYQKMQQPLRQKL